MSMPGFQTIMLPLLEFAADGHEHMSRDPVGPLVVHFGLTEDEQAQLNASGQRVFSNRVAWALTHLRQACLISTTRRGYFKITARGLSVIAEKPPSIDMRLLMRYEEYRAFLNRTGPTPDIAPVQLPNHDGNSAPIDVATQATQTPQELLD
ncbi:MAG TPA: winged helix-turn-helix domain-containing protein, partial [Ktedonobacterales bacterium]